MKVDEKLRVKERILNYISNDEEDNPKSVRDNINFFFETNNDF